MVRMHKQCAIAQTWNTKMHSTLNLSIFPCPMVLCFSLTLESSLVENTRFSITHLQSYKCATVDDVINTTTYIHVIHDAVTSTNRRLHNRLLLRLMWELVGWIYLYLRLSTLRVYINMYTFSPPFVSSFTPTHVSAICLTLSFYFWNGNVVVVVGNNGNRMRISNGKAPHLMMWWKLNGMRSIFCLM